MKAVLIWENETFPDADMAYNFKKNWWEKKTLQGDYLV